MGGFFKKDTPDEIAVQEDVNSRKGVERIIRHAFDYAQTHKLKRLCMSDKSNAMTYAGDLWQRVFKSVAPNIPTSTPGTSISTPSPWNSSRPAPVRRHRHQQSSSATSSATSPRNSLADSASLPPPTFIPAAPRSSNPSTAQPPTSPKGNCQPLRLRSNRWLVNGISRLERRSSPAKQSVKSALNDNITTPDLGGSKSTIEVSDYLLNQISKHSSNT